MKITPKWGFAFKGVGYKGGQVYEVEPEVYEEIKSEVTIVQTVTPKLQEAKNTQQKTVVTKEAKAPKAKATAKGKK